MNSLFQSSILTSREVWHQRATVYYSREVYAFDLFSKIDAESVFKEKKVTRQFSIKSIHYSLAFPRKISNLEPRLVKSYLLVNRLSYQTPSITEGERPLYTVTLKTDVNERKRLLLSFQTLINYFKSVNFFGFSPLYFSASGQINFIFIDHLPLARYLNVQYDYFAWKNPLKVTFSFASTHKKKDSRHFILYFFNSFVNII
jgi:hypothetical protein